MTTLVAEAFQDFISLFYPNYCRGCGEALVKGEEHVCTRCILELPRTDFHRNHYNKLHRRLDGRLRLDHALAFLHFVKNGTVQNLLHELKYNNQPELGITLGRVYGESLKHAGLAQQIDVIVPVPLHQTRFRKRGYNQSEEFAKGLSGQLDRPVDTTSLFRTRSTETQTRKSKLLRWENVKEVFAASRSVDGKRVLLVDDVITTGATLEACGQALFLGGCASLSIAGIAIADY